jgi:hypothetical protein
MGLAGTIVIKQSNVAQKSNDQNPTNTTFPSHSFSESKQSKSRENPGKKKTLRVLCTRRTGRPAKSL